LAGFVPAGAGVPGVAAGAALAGGVFVFLVCAAIGAPARNTARISAGGMAVSKLLGRMVASFRKSNAMIASGVRRIKRKHAHKHAN
jgi:hypothetical protein